MMPKMPGFHQKILKIKLTFLFVSHFRGPAWRENMSYLMHEYYQGQIWYLFPVCLVALIPAVYLQNRISLRLLYQLKQLTRLHFRTMWQLNHTQFVRNLIFFSGLKFRPLSSIFLGHIWFKVGWNFISRVFWLRNHVMQTNFKY